MRSHIASRKDGIDSLVALSWLGVSLIPPIEEAACSSASPPSAPPCIACSVVTKPLTKRKTHPTSAQWFWKEMRVPLQNTDGGIHGKSDI